MQVKGEVGVVYGISKVGVVGKVSMNFECIEGGKTGDKVVKFRGERSGNSERGNRLLQARVKAVE